MAAIVIVEGPRAGERVELGEGETLLGRAVSDFLSDDEEVSRRHAALRAGSGSLEIEDLGSANGTFVNEQRILMVTQLSSGDLIRVGRTSLQVEVEPADRATVIREVAPPAAAPAPHTLPQPPVEAPTEPPAFTPPPAAAQPPPFPTAPPYAGTPAAGGSGIGMAAGLVLLLAALIGLIWAIAEGLRLIDQADFLSGGYFALLLGSLVLVVVAAAFDVPGGIALMRSRPSGRTLAVLGGAAGVAGPVIFAISVITQGGSPGTLTWLGAAGTGLAHAVGLILGLVAGPRPASRY